MITRLIDQNKDISYYRIDLLSSMIYFSHAVKVSDEEYITITLKDIILKLDEAIDAVNKIEISQETVDKLEASLDKQTKVSKGILEALNKLATEVKSLSPTPKQE